MSVHMACESTLADSDDRMATSMLKAPLQKDREDTYKSKRNSAAGTDVPCPALRTLGI